MSTRDDAAFMRRALELAARGAGMVQPNPMVGAVIVRDGKIVGEGFHERYGGPHAEVHALRQAGDAARGAALYVTLEPCAHHGLTPPCADAVIAAGIASVEIAALDPNPVARGGADVLRDAGISVSAGNLERAAHRLNAPFFHWHAHRAPFVALKQAMSADARIAAAPGKRTMITGPEANAEVHRMRAMYDAILVGIGTALVDDPLLTVRGVDTVRSPVRVIADSDARLPLASQLLRTIADAPVWLLCADDAPTDRVTALEAAGVRTIRLPRAAVGIDLKAGIAALGEAGMRSIFVEAGNAIAKTLMERVLVHRLYLIGSAESLGDAGVPALVMMPDGSIAEWFENPEGPVVASEVGVFFEGQTQNWTMTHARELGSDVLFTIDLTEYA